MARTLNGEVLIDDEGNLNESLWLYNLVNLYNHYYGKNTKEQEDELNSRSFKENTENLSSTYM